MAGTVTIACKMPNGLILRLFKMVEGTELVLGGGTRKIRKAVDTGQQVTINGAASRIDRAPKHQIVGGYGLTHGVDADFWAAWRSQNDDSDLVRNHIIFAHGAVEDAIAEATEKAEVRSGLEPLDRLKMPKGVEIAKAD